MRLSLLAVLTYGGLLALVAGWSKEGGAAVSKNANPRGANPSS